MQQSSEAVSGWPCEKWVARIEIFFESAALVCTTIIFGLPSTVSDDDVSIDMTTAHCQFFIDLYSGVFLT